MLSRAPPCAERSSRASLSPAPPRRRTGKAKHSWPELRTATTWKRDLPFAGASALLSLLPFVAAGSGRRGQSWRPSAARTRCPQSIPTLLWAVPLAALAWFATLLVLILVTVRLLGVGLKEGHYPVRSRIGWQVWATERVLDMARDLLFPIYASLFTPVWLRLLGAKVGKNVEASTVLLMPKMTTIGSGAFLADDTMIASYEFGGGYIHIAPAKVGKRSFLGNSGMAAAGRTMPRNSLVAVLSAAPAKAKAGTSWLGSPPVRLRRTSLNTDESLTFAPPLRLKVARALWESCRLVPTVLVGGHRRRSTGRVRRRRPRQRLLAGSTAQRHCHHGGRRRGGRQLGGREMAAGGPHQARRAPPVEFLHLAQRGGGRVHRNGQRPVVCPRRRGHPCHGVVAARAWAQRLGTAPGVKATGCPRPILSRWAKAPPSTAAASSRRTCSMTGSWPSIRLRWKLGPPWARTG